MSEEAHTVGVLGKASLNGALVLEVNVPAGRLARLVLEGEGKDSLAVLDGVLAAGFVAAESGVDGLEGLGGRESVCGSARAQQISLLSYWLGMDGLTVLERHGGREAVEWAKRELEGGYTSCDF